MYQHFPSSPWLNTEKDSIKFFFLIVYMYSKLERDRVDYKVLYSIYLLYIISIFKVEIYHTLKYTILKLKKKSAITLNYKMYTILDENLI